MRILVTGAAGFIASHLCEKLVTLGHEVVGLDNFNDYYSPALKEMNAKDLEAKGVSIFRVDLNEDLSKVFEKPYDYIYHLAAQPGISSDTTLEEYVRNNIYATQNLLDAVSAYNPNLKSFINIATSSVYGIEATVDETIPAQPVSFYGSTKLAAEQLVLGLQRLGKIKACSIRLYSVFGPRERPEKLYTKLIDNLYNDKPFPLFEGSVKHERSFTYVGDIVDGLAAIIGKEDVVDGEIINLGTDEVNTTQDGITAVEQIMNKTLIIDNMPPRKGDQQRTAAVIEKAKKLLNYTPKVTLKQGLEEQVKWYKEKFID
ncbi:NAD-dependent epimerase/dehydratase family protein [Flavobacterium lacisediminis]|uniref:NAD-dependent epimerase/dehydratase family protein n=1 Tax=Flavobacterium lacisediminis TaxID=2989705 RepID=A0ABT3EHU2_9FLAO|nr:NAD-dependent epimerase/dehydratase family protein [Flavobacterium lacisediminis]MCW1147659.1 NAD-dependent epimerase/dehydratase family protein [Flavobacterium lacisediminis]